MSESIDDEINGLLDILFSPTTSHKEQTNAKNKLGLDLDLKQLSKKISVVDIKRGIVIMLSPTTSFDEKIEAAKLLDVTVDFNQRPGEKKKDHIRRFLNHYTAGRNGVTYTKSPLVDPEGAAKEKNARNAIINTLMHSQHNITYTQNPLFYTKTKGGYRKKHHKTHRRRKVYRRSRKN